MDLREIPNISVDCVVFGFDLAQINILLSRRNLNMYDDRYPAIDDWMLPGKHVFKSETLDQSAQRILKKLTGQDEAYKKQFRTFGNPKRIKNDKDLLWVKSKEINPYTMSVAYYFLLPTQGLDRLTKNTRWFPVKALPPLAFDHREIIDTAIRQLKEKLVSEPIIFELLPDKFTLNELQAAYEAVLDIDIDNRNFRKKALSKTYIISLEEKKTGASKKPANLFMFSKDIYCKTGDREHLIHI